MYAGYPIIWDSKIQYPITLSTNESEYIEISTALHEVIGIVNLLGNTKGSGFNVHTNNLKITCSTFEDNKSCIGISTTH